MMDGVLSLLVARATLIEQFTTWGARLSDLDAIIIAFGSILAVLHLGVLGSAVLVRRPRMHAGLIRTLHIGGFGAELLPLLGILGTVLALLMTLTNIGTATVFDIKQVAADFAPALSTTVSGISFAVINLVLNGLGLIVLKERLQGA